jgi:ABC-type multidrug transport system fused ATPase/permease subunit
MNLRKLQFSSRAVGAIRLLRRKTQVEMGALVAVKIALALLDLVLAGLLYALFSVLQVSSGHMGGAHLLASVPLFPHTFNRIACTAVIVLCIRVAGDFYAAGWTCRFSQTVYLQFMLSLLQRYLGMRWVVYVQRNRSELMRHCLTTSLDAAYGYQLLVELFASSIVTMLLLAAAFRVSVIAGCITVTLGSALLLLHRGTLRGHINRAAAGREGSLRQLQMRMSELFQLAREISVYGNSESFTSRISHFAAELAHSNKRMSQLPQIPRLLVDYGSMVVFVVVLMFAHSLHSDVSHLISLLVFYFVLSRRLLPTISQLVMVAGQVEGMLQNIEVIRDELHAASSQAMRSTLSALSLDSAAVVTLSGLSFSYPDGTPVLRNVHLSVHPGECIVLRGASGIGKSSLLHLICGLLEPSVGTVSSRIEKSQIAFVPQDVVLLDGTMRENVVFGSEDRGEPSILEALAAAQMRDFTASLPHGIESRTGDNGLLLSGGQKQRIGVARALYRRPALLLLDEATSALDIENESRLFKALKHSFPQTAIVMVTHRPHVPLFADRIFQLRDGQLAEESVMKAEGLCCNL